MKEKIHNYLRAGYAGLFITSHEEQRVEREVLAACADTDFKLYAWSMIQGVVNCGDQTGMSDTEDPMAMLDAFENLPEKSVLLARDFHALLAGDPNPMLVRKIKEVLLDGKNHHKTLVICGCRLHLPAELAKEFTTIDFALPGRDDIKVVLTNLAESAGKTLGDVIEDETEVIDAGCGMTTTECENAAALSLIENGKILTSVIAREKSSAVKKGGILEIVEPNVTLEDIGGLDRIVAWLKQRTHAFGADAKQYGLPGVKGYLAVGVPGCGKTLLAKATAQILGVPLVRLDASRLFGSLVGETEANTRAVTETVDAIGRCVLHIDEIEKAFSGGGDGQMHETSKHMMGTMLQWMNDRTSPAFIAATANDVTQLRPELLRKGRWDEMWFVDLPNDREREDIWKIQIRKFGRDPSKFNLPELSKVTSGFTGSEIEALFKESLFHCFDDGRAEPTVSVIEMLAGQTIPLSKTMEKEIEGLRSWAKNRARPATSPQVKAKGGSRKIIMGDNTTSSN